MKHYLLLTLSLFFFFIINAQNTLYKSDFGQTEVAGKKNSLGSEEISFFNTDREGDNFSMTKKSDDATNIPEPKASFNSSVKMFRNVDTGEVKYYTSEYDEYKDEEANTWVIRSLTLSFLDDNLEVEGNPLTVEFPKLTRSFVIGNEFTSSYIILFVQYFVPTVNPANRKPEIWLISLTDGSIVKKFSLANSAFIFNNMLVVSEMENIDDDEVLTFYDYKTFELKKTLENLPTIDYTRGMEGGSFLDITIDDKNYYGIARFQDIYYENSAMSYNVENNFLLLDLYDADTFEEVKNIRVPLESIVDPTNLGEVNGQPAFGVMAIRLYGFPHFGWNFSTNKFNNDDKIEFIVSVEYELFASSGRKFVYYYVVNEDGEVVKKLEESFLFSNGTFNTLNNLEGFNDLIGFTETDNAGNQSIAIFDVNEWKIISKFPANYEGYNLSMNLVRINFNDSFQYLIATGNIQEGNGIIAQFGTDGKLTRTIPLPLPEDAKAFTPMLSGNTIDPHLINDDDDREFLYSSAYEKDGLRFYTFNIGKDNELLYTWDTHATHGKLAGGGLVEDSKTQKMGWLKVSYEDGTNDYYKLPLTGGSSIAKGLSRNESSIYYNPNTKNLIADESINIIEVYTVNGILSLRSTLSETSASQLQKGVYMVKTTDKDGVTSFKKIFIY